MIKNLKNKIIAGTMASIMLVGIAPTKVFASEDVVSKEKLEIIVQEEVNNLDFENLQIDKIIEGINNSVKDEVTETVQGVLTTENIKEMIRPIVKTLVNETIKDVNLPEQVDINKIIDDIIDNEIMDKILTNELTEEIIERTVEYAVDDIMDIISIPTTGEIIETSKEQLTVNVVEDIWNANPISILNKFEINPYHSYEIQYKYNIIPVSIKSTGWNRNAINIKIQTDLLKVVGKNTQAPDLSSIDYEAIIKNAAKRAVTDIINEKITEVKIMINSAIENKINELKQETEQAVQNVVSNILNKIPSWSKK